MLLKLIFGAALLCPCEIVLWLRISFINCNNNFISANVGLLHYGTLLWWANTCRAFIKDLNLPIIANIQFDISHIYLFVLKYTWRASNMRQHTLHLVGRAFILDIFWDLCVLPTSPNLLGCLNNQLFAWVDTLRAVIIIGLRAQISWFLTNNDSFILFRDYRWR